MDWTIAAPRLKVSVMRDAGYLPSVNNLRPHLLTGATKGLLSALPVPCIKCSHQCLQSYLWQRLLVLWKGAESERPLGCWISAPCSPELLGISGPFLTRFFLLFLSDKCQSQFTKIKRKELDYLLSINAYDFTLLLLLAKFTFCFKSQTTQTDLARHYQTKNCRIYLEAGQKKSKNHPRLRALSSSSSKVPSICRYFPTFPTGFLPAISRWPLKQLLAGTALTFFLLFWEKTIR